MEDLFEAIVETAHEALLVLDGDFKIVCGNRAFFKKFGVLREEALSRSIYELSNRQWDFPALRQLLEVVLPAESHVEDFEAEVHFSRIGYRCLVFNARQIVARGNKTIVLAVEDVTERKQTNEDLRKLNAKLANSNRELESFAQVASHDLQEPLRKIIAFADRLISGYGDRLDPQGRDYLSRLQKSTFRMQTLINDLLAFSRLALQVRQFRPVDLNKIAREVLEDLEEKHRQTNARIVLGDLPEIEADPMQIRQLLQNLLGNALKYVRPGVSPEIEVSGEIDELPGGQPFCRLVITDNGIGFDQKYSTRIFQVFQRLHTQRKYEGTGIGLAICRRIVESHGGTIMVESKEQQGSKFILTLPVRQSGYL